MINIYTVFLNRFDILEFQIKSFVKNIKNNFILNVLDNSFKKEDSKKLKIFCKKKDKLLKIS
jgi:hypothetical protein